MKQKRTAAATGAGSGPGRDVALGLAEKSYRVSGTAMSAEEAAAMHEASPGRVVLTRVDITDWDVLQPVGDASNFAPWLAPNIPRADPDGMF